MSARTHPPGGAAGSIASTLPLIDGRSQSANGGTSTRQGDRSAQPERRAGPAGAADLARHRFRWRSGALRLPVGAPAQPRLSGSPITRRDLPKVPAHATNLRRGGGSARCRRMGGRQRAGRPDLRRTRPPGRGHRAPPPRGGPGRPPVAATPPGARDRRRGDRARGVDGRSDAAGGPRRTGRPDAGRRTRRGGPCRAAVGRCGSPDPGRDGGTRGPATSAGPSASAAPRAVAPSSAAPKAVPVVEEGVQAARRQGWKLVDRDEFTGALGTKWGEYDGEGHEGEGRRTPTRSACGAASR